MCEVDQDVPGKPWGDWNHRVAARPARYRFALPMTGKRLYILNRGAGGISSPIPGKKRRWRRFVVYILCMYVYIYNNMVGMNSVPANVFRNESDQTVSIRNGRERRRQCLR